MSNGYSHQLSVNLTPGSSTFKLKWGECCSRQVFYSITTGRTTEIAEVSRRQPLDDWKIGPKALANGKQRREKLMRLEAAIACCRDSALSQTGTSLERSR